MNGYEFVTAIVAITGGTAMFIGYLLYKFRAAAANQIGQDGKPEMGGFHQRMQALDDRVANLETAIEGVREQVADVLLDSADRAPALGERARREDADS